MKKAELEKEWLASSATTAFMGALFVAYGWHISDGTINLPFNVTSPGLPDWVYFALGSLLSVLAFVLLTASMAPVVRPWVVRAGHYFAPILGLLALVAFALSWAAASPTLQEINRWWSEVLYWGGPAFLLLLALRFIFSGGYKAKSNNDEPKVAEEPSLRTALFVGGLVLFLLILGRISSGQSPKDGD